MKYSCLLMLTYLLSVFYSHAQDADFVELNKIQDQKVLKFLSDKNLKSTSNFKALKNVCAEEGNYSTHMKNYEIPYSFEKVWKHYSQGNVKEIWSGNKLKFKLAYNSFDNRFLYEDNDEFSIREDQVIISKLSFFRSLMNIVVAHRIYAIDEDEKTITFCYTEGGKSEGTQIIKISRKSPSETVVTHVTFYRNKSKIRDKYLYPFFHTLVIDQLHENLFRLIELDNQNPTVHKY